MRAQAGKAGKSAAFASATCGDEHAAQQPAGKQRKVLKSAAILAVRPLLHMCMFCHTYA